MASTGIAHREWAIYRSDYETDEEFRQAVEAESVLNVHLLDRLGVGVVSVPLRRKVGDTWFTEGVVFQTATVPAAREPQPEPEPDGDLIEVPAEA